MKPPHYPPSRLEGLHNSAQAQPAPADEFVHHHDIPFAARGAVEHMQPEVGARPPLTVLLIRAAHHEVTDIMACQPWNFNL